MNRQTRELIDAVNELDFAFDTWVASMTGDREIEFKMRTEMARAVGKVKGLAFILESEIVASEPRPFSSFQHSEHLYGTENSQG